VLWLEYFEAYVLTFRPRKYKIGGLAKGTVLGSMIEGGLL